MKKLLVSGLVAIILFVSAVYIFIPSTLAVSDSGVIKCTANALYRSLGNPVNWQKWWPGDVQKDSHRFNGDSVYTYQGWSFIFAEKKYHTVEIKLKKENQVYESTLVLIPVNSDSVAVEWRTSIETSHSIFTKLKKYREAVSIKKNMMVILDSLKTFAANGNNIYELPIRRTTITDTVLVTAKTISGDYPSIPLIYSLVEKLQAYIALHNTSATNAPMLNISEKGSQTFEMTVAIPVGKELTNSGEIVIKRFTPVKDKALVAVVTGGPASIRNGARQMQYYMVDHDIETAGLSFESLVTDRSKERDTSKWITHLYYPIR